MDMKPAGLGGTIKKWVYRKLFMLDEKVQEQSADLYCLREEVRDNKVAAAEHVNLMNQHAIAVLHQTRNESQNLHSMLTRTVHDFEVRLNQEISLLRAEVKEVRGALTTHIESTSAGRVNYGLPMQTGPVSIVIPNSPAGDSLEAIQGVFVASPPAANAEAGPPEKKRKTVIKSATLHENCPRCGKTLTKKYLPTHIRKACPQREMKC